MFGSKIEEIKDPDAEWKRRLLADGMHYARRCDKLASEYHQLGGKGYLERRNVLGVSIEDTVEEIERHVRSLARRKSFYQRKVNDLADRAPRSRPLDAAIEITTEEIERRIRSFARNAPVHGRKTNGVAARLPRKRPLGIIAGRILIDKKNAA